jgi:hypothetical protein
MKVADYVLRAKARLGDRHMSDGEFGLHLGGFARTTVSNARYGNMSDHMALKVAEVLGIEAGELLHVARAEREKDPAVKRALVEWAWRKRSVSSRASAKRPPLTRASLWELPAS